MPGRYTELNIFCNSEACLAITYFTVWVNSAEVLPKREGPPL